MLAGMLRARVLTVPPAKTLIRGEDDQGAERGRTLIDEEHGREKQVPKNGLQDHTLSNGLDKRVDHGRVWNPRFYLSQIPNGHQF